MMTLAIQLMTLNQEGLTDTAKEYLKTMQTLVLAEQRAKVGASLKRCT